MTRQIHTGSRPPPNPVAGASFWQRRDGLFVYMPRGNPETAWVKVTVTDTPTEPTTDSNREQAVTATRVPTSAEYADYAKALIEAIKDGSLDDHLDAIAGAAFARAKAIGLVQASKPTTPNNAPPEQGMRDDNGHRASWFQQASDGRILIVGRVPAVATAGLDTRTVFGREYKRTDFMDHYFRIQPGTYDSNEWDGVPVKIRGMGDKTIKVDFPDGVRTPGNKDVVFINYNKVRYLFGDRNGN